METHIAEIAKDVALLQRKNSENWCPPRQLSSAGISRQDENGVEKFKHPVFWSSEVLLLEEDLESATIPAGLHLTEIPNNLIITKERDVYFIGVIVQKAAATSFLIVAVFKQPVLIGPPLVSSFNVAFP